MNLFYAYNGYGENFRRNFLRDFRQYFSSFVVVLTLGFMSQMASANAKQISIVAFGDSLTAGLGVDPQQNYPTKLQAALRAKGYDVVISNAGVSGDTTRGGLARLDWAIGDDVDIVILELGANDALRGIDPSETRKSLTQIVDKLLKKNKKILLAGMIAPPNLGTEYGIEFAQIFKDLSNKKGVVFYPFFLKAVAEKPNLVQLDGMHPKAMGYEAIVKDLLPVIEMMLK